MSSVVVGMSGGVDSSVAAALLKEQGHRVTGVFMKIWDGENVPVPVKRHACYGPDEAEDIEDARAVARVLGVDFHVFDLRQEYQAEVLDYFRHEYRSGRTPNPCLRCNHRIKFAALLNRARASGIEFDYFATGHYARIGYDKERRRYLLKKAVDPAKDQSYFLSFLSQEQLAESLFPVGGYTKAEVRQLATDYALPVHRKPESQDFVAGDYISMVGTALPGPLLDKSNNILGEHRGIANYTIGQRKGLGVATGQPLYVTDIDSERNAVIVGGREELYQDELVAVGLNWIAFEKLEGPLEVGARIRRGAAEAVALVTPVTEDRVYVKFCQPQLAITPGQAVVFYRGDVMLGSGTIEKKRVE